VHARCQRVALLAHHFATKGYRHGPLWSAREASQTIQCILSECGGLPGLQRRIASSATEGITLDSTPCSSSLEKNYRHQRSKSAYRTQRLVPPLILKVESKVSASTGAVLQRFFHQRAASYADADRHPKNYSSAQMGMYMSKLQMWSITATTAHCAIGHRSQRCYIPQQQCAARHQVIIHT